MKGTYHYEYKVVASNLNYGGLHIGTFRSYSEARHAGETAGRGVYSIRKVRVYN